MKEKFESCQASLTKFLPKYTLYLENHDLGMKEMEQVKVELVRLVRLCCGNI
jgi:hypothetical protein